NMQMTAPETRLIQVRRGAVSRLRSNPVPLVRISHQRAEPAKTPTTSAAAEVDARSPLATPNPAKIATNDRIVVGLVSVNPKGDQNARSPSVGGRGVSPVASSSGRDRTVLTPR